MVCWTSACTVYGFSPPVRCSGASASARASASAASVAAGLPPASLRVPRYATAPMPARRPKTSRSDRELPPSRLEPCMPPDTSPAANRPGRLEAAVSGSTSTPPIT